jgi:glycosyltransferase involved in cell wall biosynthesis
MNILHFATSDIIGGAAKASFRIHNLFKNQGHSSKLYVLYKKSKDNEVFQIKANVFSNNYLLKCLRSTLKYRLSLSKSSYMFNFNRGPSINFASKSFQSENHPDAIFLHWITDFLTTESIRKIYQHYQCPIFWVMMDMEPITGGCHYFFGCEGYKSQCQNCPQIMNRDWNNYPHTTWLEKCQNLQNLPIHFICGSNELVNIVKDSSLFGEHPTIKIALPIDIEIFHPFDQKSARALLKIPQNKKVIFSGASSLNDSRKGMTYLIDALHHLERELIKNGDNLLDDIIFLFAGKEDNHLLDSLNIKIKRMGYITDDHRLALAYQASDIFVSPSIEDAGPMMISEAMLCGTPVVAFNIGMATELIVHMKNGYIAKIGDSADLAMGIHYLLKSDCIADIKKSAEETAKKVHSPENVGNLYSDLFASLMFQVS